MNKKIMLVAVITSMAVFVTSCGMTGGGTSETKSNKSEPAGNVAEKINVGDRVIAKWSKNSFYEGMAESFTDTKVKVKWDDGSSPSDIDKSDVFSMPKAGAKPDVAVGEMVLAKISSGNYWNGAEITKIEGDVYSVKDIDGGQTVNLSSEKILKVPPVVIADLKEKSESNDFLQTAKSKKPSIPADFKTKNGEQVLAEWSTNSWWQGKVQKVSGDKATIEWEDGSKPSDVDVSKIMPYPKNGDAKMPEANQYILVKPEAGSKWIYAQAVSITGSAIEIKDQNGKTRTVKAGEFVPLD